MNVVIAVDGPSGSGKSTVSKAVARKLGLGYLDTGAMYRAAAWWAHHSGIDLDDHEAVTAAVAKMDLHMPLDPDAQNITVAGTDITAAIRTSELSRVVSKVAVNLDVRAILVARQQAIIRSAGRIIAEGRDITTVVAPDADVRVLLTASEKTRLERRALENQGTKDSAALAATRAEVTERDAKDATVTNFTTAADGVVTIDSSRLSIEQTRDAIIDLVPEEMR